MKKETVKLNPIEYIEKHYGNSPSHINFDVNVKHEYKIIRQSSHDGTMLFTMSTIERALMPLLRMESHFKLTAPESWDTVSRINYTIGEIEIDTEFGMVDLPAGRYHGQTDIVSIPVKCEYIFKSS